MVSRKHRTISETDLCPPLRAYLVEQGYTVRSEVKNCDVAAVKGDELIVIELKRSLSLGLIEQAVKRQEVADSVYVAVPRPPNIRQWLARTRGAQRILRRLEIGLILVPAGKGGGSVEVVFHPIESPKRRQSRARRAVLREIAGRSGDYNEGGSTRRRLITGYRENAIHIACCLERFGDLSPKLLRSLGTGEKTLSILSSNFYGWFERVERGIYRLTARGKDELAEYPELASRFRKALDQVELSTV